MKEYTVTADAPAVVSLSVKVKAKNAVEAKKIARVLFKRATDDLHQEEGWDGVIMHEENPDVEILSVDFKGVKLEATNWDAAPILCTHPITGKFGWLKNTAEYLSLCHEAEVRK